MIEKRVDGTLKFKVTKIEDGYVDGIVLNFNGNIELEDIEIGEEIIEILRGQTYGKITK